MHWESKQWHQYSLLMRETFSICLGIVTSEADTELGMASLEVGEDTTVKIQAAFPGTTAPDCDICVMTSNSKVTCDFELRINSGESVSYNFSCSNPEAVFTQTVEKNIVCSTDSCPTKAVELQPSGLPSLNTTFIWNITTDTNDGLGLSFSTPLLRQLKPSETCQDSVTYGISSLSTEAVNIGNFCGKGSVSRVTTQGGARLTLQAPWNIQLNDSGFSIEKLTRIKTLCVIEVSLNPHSPVFLSSPNYPLGFPDDELMTWKFLVPPTYSASILFLNYSHPDCIKDEAQVEYYLPNFDANPRVMRLVDRQPAGIPGNFDLLLRNCEADKQSSQSLSLHFKIELHHNETIGSTVERYAVDLRSMKGINVRIAQKTRSVDEMSPSCLICLEPKDCVPHLTLNSENVYEIYFRCDKLADLVMTANIDIACTNVSSCSFTNFSSDLPKSVFHLPLELEGFTWNLSPPPQTSVELQFNRRKLQQVPPGQKCNGPIYYDISSTLEGGETSVLGMLCPGGSIEKIKVKSNVTIVLKTSDSANGSESLDLDLAVSFIPYIRENYIFTVSPEAETSTNLWTPDWETGLLPNMFISWDIQVPPEQVAMLTFLNKTKPSCKSLFSRISLKEQTAEAEELNNRDDEPLPMPQHFHHSFWVNISNCESDPEDQSMRVLFSVIMSTANSDLLYIIISAVAACLLLLSIIVCIICIKKRRKERRQTPIGIYNDSAMNRVTVQHGLFHKGRQDNESHIYAVIDDTMIYGLATEPKEPTIAEVDVYRPFEGRIGDSPPVTPPVYFRKKDSDEDFPMVHNELYTFLTHNKEVPKSNGQTNVPLLEETEKESSD
nr:PREDICTED: CUB domain-containing protein 1 isoform X1 [Latimeria chalumnae]|eukprot:XP_005999054.1 PREDICTED: CUB domain-containing protein 1 isoform X1 [Latimeria chalumnae]